MTLINYCRAFLQDSYYRQYKREDFCSLANKQIMVEKIPSLICLFKEQKKAKKVSSIFSAYPVESQKKLCKEMVQDLLRNWISVQCFSSLVACTQVLSLVFIFVQPPGTFFILNFVKFCVESFPRRERKRNLAAISKSCDRKSKWKKI